MEKLSDSVKSLRLKLGKRRSYDCESGSPSFKLKALGLRGMKVSGTESKFSKEAVLQLLDIWDSQEAPNVVLMISAHKGIRVMDKKKTELFSYKIHDIAYCSVDRERKDIFVFIGNKVNDMRCHAFFCDDNTKADSLCLTMAHAFDVAFRNWKKQQKILTDKNANVLKSERKKSLNDIAKQERSSKDGKECITRTISARKQSTQSNVSTFSYGSGTSEVFRSLESFDEEDDDDLPLLLRRGSTDWKAIGSEKRKAYMSGDGNLLENETSTE